MTIYATSPWRLSVLGLRLFSLVCSRLRRRRFVRVLNEVLDDSVCSDVKLQIFLALIVGHYFDLGTAGFPCKLLPPYESRKARAFGE